MIQSLHNWNVYRNDLPPKRQLFLTWIKYDRLDASYASDFQVGHSRPSREDTMMGKLPSSTALASVIFVGLSSPLLLGTASAAETKEVVVDAKISNESNTCLQCHGPLTPALAAEWRQSAHAAKGVGCYE